MSSKLDDDDEVAVLSAQVRGPRRTKASSHSSPIPQVSKRADDTDDDWLATLEISRPLEAVAEYNKLLAGEVADGAAVKAREDTIVRLAKLLGKLKDVQGEYAAC